MSRHLTHRMTRAGLLGLLVAAAIGRAALAADTEAAVVFHPAFQTAVLPAVLTGALGAMRFGSVRLADLALAALTVLAALLLGAGAAVMVTGGPDLKALSPSAVPQGLAALAAAFGLTQLLAWRQGRPGRRQR